MLAYMICGFLVGIAALFFVATYTTVQPGYGDQYNNEAIAGCVMGGTSMVGGLASIGGTVIGVFIISLLQQGIMAFGLGKGQQMIITGTVSYTHLAALPSRTPPGHAEEACGSILVYAGGDFSYFHSQVGVRR